MMPAYFTTDEMSRVQIEDIDNSKYSVDMSKYDEKADTNTTTSYDDINGIATNANANDKLSPLTGSLDPLMKGLEKGFGWLKNTNPLEKVGIYFGNLINNSIKSLTGGFEGIEEFFKSLASKNSSINRGIDELSILPTNKNYWKIELDKKNPFMSSLFNFVESMNRVVKAPFSLATASLAAGMNAVQSKSNTSSSTATMTNNPGSSSSNGTTSSSSGTNNATTSNGGVLSGLWQGIKNTASKIMSNVKGFFGLGRDKNDSDDSGYGSDPYHIYQRDYSGSYRTAGDSESQTIADSGCGPASAASVLRMYGKKGDMHNAVNYALNNKYKEVNGGTYPEYFNSYLNRNGIKTNSNANNADVVNSLAQGKPVILMGRDSQNSGRTPYGSKYSHYVVARGLDKNGNVIVEDSEDKRGSTRYSLADTLQNSTVRITTGRGKNNESLANKYISSVSAVTNSAISGMMYNAAKSLGVNFGSSSNNATINDNTGLNVRGDAKAAIGKSYTATLEGESVTLTMDEGGAEIYSFLVNDCGCSTAAACGAIGNWVQECGGGTIENIKPVALKGYIAEGGGLMQWTLPYNDHPAWARAHGFSDWEWAGQLAHVKEELTEGSNWSKNRIKKAASQIRSMGFNVANNVDEYKKLTKPDEAAVNFERGLEGSADFWGKVASSESYKNIKYKHLYCFKRRLFALAVYGLVTGQSSSGSGRGIDKLSTTGRAKVPDPINFANSGEIERQEKLAEMGLNNIWTAGVPVDNTTSNTDTNDKITSPNKITSIDKLAPTSETTKEDTTTATDSTTTPTDNNKSVATGLIGLLGEYTRRATKDIFGNFYDALYGTETNNTTPDNTAAYNGNDIIYAAAMVFEALYNADPNLTYDCNCVKYNDLVCRDGTVLEHERPDCSGMMSAVIHYMGYYTARWSAEKNYSDTYHGEGFGTQNWNGASSNTCIYDKDGNLSSDWEVLKFDPNDVQPGDIRFHSGHGHTDMYVFTNSQGTRFGFNAGSGDSGGSIGNGMYNSYCLAKYYLDNNNQLPDPDSCHGKRGEPGAWTIQDNECKLVLRYKGKGSGNGRFGRGSARNGKTDLAKLNRIPISKRKVTDSNTIPSIVTRDVNRDLIAGTYRTGYGRGTGPLKSLDDIRSSSRVHSSNNTNANNNTIVSPHTGRGSTGTINSTYTQYGGDSLANILRLAAIIADNSNKIDDILAVLATIAVNTENTTTAIGNSNNNKIPNGSKNGLSALRTALNDNNSGEDIINAIYQIAKS
jgi:hypothetical protein